MHSASSARARSRGMFSWRSDRRPSRRMSASSIPLRQQWKSRRDRQPIARCCAQFLPLTISGREVAFGNSHFTLFSYPRMNPSRRVAGSHVRPDVSHQPPRRGSWPRQELPRHCSIPRSSWSILGKSRPRPRPDRQCRRGATRLAPTIAGDRRKSLRPPAHCS